MMKKNIRNRATFPRAVASVVGGLLCAALCVLAAEAETGSIETSGVVPTTFTASGKIQGVARSAWDRLWVVVRKREANEDRHWPKGVMAGARYVTNVIVEGADRWKAPGLYENSPAGFDLLLVIVDERGQDQIQAWGKDCDSRKSFPGIPIIIGMRVLDTVTLKTTTP